VVRFSMFKSGETVEEGRRASLNQQKIIVFLSILLLLYSVNNIYYFLFIKEVDLLSLLFWNVCTPLSLFTVPVLIFGEQRRTLSSTVIPPLLWFGFGGLFMFWWGWFTLQLVVFMHGHHITMTGTAFYLAKNRWDHEGIYVGLIALVLYFTAFSVIGSHIQQPW